MEKQVCTKCILDTNDDKNITFNEEGVCSYCHNFDRDYGTYLNMSLAEKDKNLHKMVEQMKADGKGKKYDCICGLSGGVDSSFLAAKAKEFGLRTLLVHFDNGWNSELAVKNIEQICKYTGFDLSTYVVNWEEFKDLQKAYIKAGVLDWEVPTDHGLWAVILKKSKELNIKHILIGANYQTEGVLPNPMRYDKADLKNIKDIYRKFGSGKRFKSFPTYTHFPHMYMRWFGGLKLDTMLYFMEYNKNVSKQYLIDVVGWRDYGGKHYESIFTRFYQGYVLKEKFGCDKRKAHLASLICSGQMTRKQALEELKQPAIDPELLKNDLQFFLKKMGFTEDEFTKIMNSKPVPHLNFKSYNSFEYPAFKKILKFLVASKKIIKRKK
ncbi:MAG: N-acetyl sugar amidotransferase [Bacteroidota bacterium]